MRVHLDFETFCELNLKAVGRVRYFAHPSFDVDLTGWAVDDGPVYQVEKRVPSELVEALYRADTVHAYGAGFEIGVLQKYGIKVPLGKWRCTMAHAYARGFSGDLGEVGEQVGIPENLRKVKDGRRLVLKFSKPRKPSKHNKDTRWTSENAFDDWEEYCYYNLMDVEAERAVYQILEALEPWSDSEQEIWEFDYEVNARGIPVDTELVERALSLVPWYTEESQQVCQDLTGGIKASQVTALLAWCRGRGYPHDTLKADTIEKALKETSMPEEVERALRARLDFAQAATKKYTAINNRHFHSRVQDTMIAWGASRTGRWAGRGLQFQNLKRPNFKTQGEVDHAVKLLLSNPSLFYRTYSLEDLGSLIRSAVCAPEGSLIVDADLSNIEPRMAGWLTGCKALNQIFQEGKDPYKAFAVSWLGIPYEQVSGATRNECKPPFLGCGYRLGPDGLIAYAENYGVDLSPERSASAVQTFRQIYWEIPRMWKKLEAWWRLALINGASGPFKYDDRMLRLRLPSGRELYYDYPESKGSGFGSLSFMGKDQYLSLIHI